MKWKKWLYILGAVYIGLLYWNFFKESEEADETENIKNHYQIALTFDDGPSIYTEELLEGLEERGVKATFFVVGENVERYPETVKREARDGHLIGNHTYTHVDICKLPDEAAKEELGRTNELLKELLGEEPQYVRPPFGSWQKKLEAEVGMIPVLWTIDTLDWTTDNVDEIVNRVVTEARENDIILMHDYYKSSVQAALEIVDALQAKGFEFVTVDEILMP